MVNNIQKYTKQKQTIKGKYNKKKTNKHIRNINKTYAKHRLTQTKHNGAESKGW